MLNRRSLILSGLGSSTAGHIQWVKAATAKFKIGVLGISELDRRDSYAAAFVEELARRGFKEGENVEFVDRHCDNDLSRLTGLASELVGLQVDVIFATAREAVTAAHQATSSIPIVMLDSADAVRAGWISSFAHPGGNITGNATFAAEIEIKQLELLIETLGAPTRLANVVFRAFRKRPIVIEQVARLEAIAKKRGVYLRTVDVPDGRALGPLFESLAAARVQGVMVNAYAALGLEVDEVGALMRYRIPTIMTDPIYARAGVLLAYATNAKERIQKAAVYVAKILNGARPADLPVELPTRFYLAINLKTAATLGLQIPTSVLVRADEVIR